MLVVRSASVSIHPLFAADVGAGPSGWPRRGFSICW